MNLCIDIGNSRLKMALFDETGMKSLHRQPKDLDIILKSYNIDAAIISKTGADDIIEHKLKRKKVKLLALSHKLKLPIKLKYKTPDTLGADRIAGVVAANEQHRDKPVLKIDFGTCITYDYINEKNEFLGGAISPGLEMRLQAMHDYSAKLPRVRIEDHNEWPIVGNDTSSCILSGAVTGIEQEVDGKIKYYIKRFGKLAVVVTGGDMTAFAPLIKKKIFVRPFLVLEGLNRILNYNVSRK